MSPPSVAAPRRRLPAPHHRNTALRRHRPQRSYHQLGVCHLLPEWPPGTLVRPGARADSRHHRNSCWPVWCSTIAGRCIGRAPPKSAHGSSVSVDRPSRSLKLCFRTTAAWRRRNRLRSSWMPRRGDRNRFRSQRRRTCGHSRTGCNAPTGHLILSLRCRCQPAAASPGCAVIGFALDGRSLAPARAPSPVGQSMPDRPHRRARPPKPPRRSARTIARC